MTNRVRNMKVYLYTRRLEDNEVDVDVQCSKHEHAKHWGDVQCSRHWGIVVEIVDHDRTKDEGAPKVLFEANNEQGFLWATHRAFKSRDMAKPGAELKLVTDNDVLTSIDLLEAFCDGWNQKRYRFGALKTCQFFAEKLCEFLGLSLKDWSIGSLIVSGVSVVAVGIVAFIAFAFGRRSANSDRR